jgi:hypothetical protein
MAVVIEYKFQFQSGVETLHHAVDTSAALGTILKVICSLSLKLSASAKEVAEVV